MNFIACVKKWLNTSNTPLNELIENMKIQLMSKISGVYKGCTDKTKIISSSESFSIDTEMAGSMEKLHNFDARQIGTFVCEYDGYLQFGFKIKSKTLHTETQGSIPALPDYNYEKICLGVRYLKNKNNVINVIKKGYNEISLDNPVFSDFFPVNKGDLLYFEFSVSMAETITSSSGVTTYYPVTSTIELDDVWIGYTI